MMITLKKILKTIPFISILFISLSSQAGLISGDKWGDPTLGTAGGEVTWSLMDDGISCLGPFEPTPCTISSLSSFMPTGFATELEKAFSLWSSVANISFKLIADGGEHFGAPPGADIRIGGHAIDGASGNLAHAYFPDNSNAGGDIHFDIAEDWSIDNTSFFDVFTVAVHEIGHAIGLGHSLITSASMHPQYKGAISNLHADDITTVQAIYGPAALQASVPEPNSLILFMSMIGLVLVNKRQRK